MTDANNQESSRCISIINDPQTEFLRGGHWQSKRQAKVPLYEDPKS